MAEDASPAPGAAEKTCLHGQHVALGATLMDFHGWEMPVRYTSIPEEHQKVRLSAGIFDLCHMGRLELSGKDAPLWIQRVITNDYDAMKVGEARYTLICSDDGSILDDAIVYKLPERVFLVVNASNRLKVIQWLLSHRDEGDAALHDLTKKLAMIAVQGPQSLRIISSVVERLDGDWEKMKYYSIATAQVMGKVARVARTGYTGEDGFEVYLDAADAPAFWRQVLDVGGNRVSPVGLGARDTLRLEAGMPLYGHEIDSTTDPFEAGLGFAVKLSKKVPFIGQRSLEARSAEGPKRSIKGFRVLGRRVARQGMKILRPSEGSATAAQPVGPQASAAQEAAAQASTAQAAAASSPAVPSPPALEEVGLVTSGAPSPTLGYPIAMGYLRAGTSEASLFVDIRGHLEPLQVESLPFYSRTRKKAK